MLSNYEKALQMLEKAEDASTQEIANYLVAIAQVYATLATTESR